MNELSDLLDLRADAPLPGDDRLAPRRATLMEAIRKDGARGRGAATRKPVSPRRRTFLVTGAGAAALAVTGAALTTLPDGTPAASGRQLLSPQASADALELAAATVEKSVTAEPGPRQWVYEKTTSLGWGNRGDVKSTWSDRDERQTSEEWTRWDGTGAARLPGLPPAGDTSGFDPDELQVWYGPNREEQWRKEGYDDRSQRQFWRFLVTLPSEPGRMMRRIREEHAIGDIEGETRAERDWREVSVLHRSVLIPSNVRAGLFRSLARIPGARVERGVKDPLGRPAMCVSVRYDRRAAAGWQGKQELFFDPTTFAYLGEVKRAAPAKLPAGFAGKGTEAIVSARAAWGVVDKPGARP
ncbi:CU044_5270 family protein [Streptomyces cadmiisoli]|uniref:CU044_5270 family protein n=1 Tax=Streptomyces cadmiisoli TaxID=2184053 RepID=UPI003D73A30F